MIVNPLFRRLSNAALVFLCAAGAVTPASAATFTVTSTNDTGAGSLRQAILDATATNEVNTIEFNIPGSGVKTITPVTDLPNLPPTITVNGFSQPGSSPNSLPTGSNAVLLIEIRGPGSNGDGLHFGFGGTTLRGLVINGWNGTATSAGVHADSSHGGNLIEGCYIGTNAAGTASIPNGIGIWLEDSSAEIGHHFNAPTDLTADGARNVISGNTGDGLLVTGNGAIISGNHIGVDASGLIGLGNGGDGVEINSASIVQLGNTTTQTPGLSDGNIIGDNGGNGVRITGASSEFNGAFMAVIGTDLSGTIPLGNAGAGFLIEGGASHCSVNGFAAGHPSIIAFNGGPGLAITGTSARNSLSDTALYGNAGLNIDLGSDGQTANDACDADTGPNNFQNKPVLTAAPTVSGLLHVQGTLQTEMNKNYSIAYYVSSSCDLANPAAGTYTGESKQVNPGASCTANFDHALNYYTLNRQAGEDYIVGIANQDYPGDSGNSEISNCIALPSFLTPGVNLNLQKTASPDPATEGLPLIYTLAVANNGMTTGQSVVVTDPLPPGTTYLIGDPGCANSKTNTVTCNYGSVAGNGSSSVLHFSVIPTAPGAVTNTATASSSVADDNTADNSDTVVTPVSMAVYDFEATNNGTAFICPPNPKKQVCQLDQAETFLNNSAIWLTGTLEITSTCKKVGTPSVSCKIAGGFTVNTFNPLGVAANEVTAYLSSDTTVDAGDQVLVSAPSIALAALAPKHKAVKIKYKHPKGQSYAGQFVLIKLDSLDAVGETDESNNVLVIGSFP